MQSISKKACTERLALFYCYYWIQIKCCCLLSRWCTNYFSAISLFTSYQLILAVCLPLLHLMIGGYYQQLCCYCSSNYFI